MRSQKLFIDTVCKKSSRGSATCWRIVTEEKKKLESKLLRNSSASKENMEAATGARKTIIKTQPFKRNIPTRRPASRQITRLPWR